MGLGVQNVLGINALNAAELFTGIFGAFEAQGEAAQFAHDQQVRVAGIDRALTRQGQTGLFGEDLQRQIPLVHFDDQGNRVETVGGISGQPFTRGVGPVEHIAGAFEIRDLALGDIQALDQSFVDRQAEGLGIARSRQAQGLRQLEGFGNQQRRDLQQDFREQRSTGLGAIANRGLGGSLASNFAQSNARQGQDALNRLNEGLTAFKSGVFERLSGDVLNTFGQLSGDTLANRQTGNQQRLTATALPLNTFIGFDDKLQNFRANVPQQPPGPNFLQELSQIASGVNASFNSNVGGGKESTGETALNAFTGGAANAAGELAVTAASKLIVAACVDGAAEITMDDWSTKLLRDVAIGEWVMGSDHEPVEVIGKDYGLTPDERKNDFVVINVDNFSLVLTSDHHMGGRPAREYDGAVPHVAPETSGDLKLDGDGGYIANGFPVDSMFAVYNLAGV